MTLDSTAPERAGSRALSRRALLTRTLKAGAYAAPIILASSSVAHVSAATPAPLLCGTSITFVQDIVILNAAPGVSYDVYAAPNGAGAAKVATLTADANFGAAFGSAALTVPSSGVFFVTLAVVLASSPATPALATFNSTLVTTVACTAGGPRAATAVVGRAFQETTNCGGASSTYLVTLDVAVLNAAASTAYDVYYAANNAVSGGLVRAGTVTTNAQGNVTGILSVTVNTATPTPPTSIRVMVVLAGAGAGATGTPLVTPATLSGGGVVNVVCYPGITPTASRPPLQLLAIT